MAGDVMRGQILKLILLIVWVAADSSARVVRPQDSRPGCPRVTVECPDDYRGDAWTFKAKLSGENVTERGLTYKWVVSGGEIKEGQGTNCVIITGFDLNKGSLSVSMTVGGLPEGCSRENTCTVSA
jgi:hypothetical protein